MGRISDEDVARVREATDVVTLIGERVPLRPKGRLQWGLCPFHGEKTPSFKVDPSTQMWHCFGCGKGGDVFGFVMETDHVEFPDAVRILADRAHVDIHEEEGGAPRGQKERLIAACDGAAEFYSNFLTRSRDSGAASARAYLANRGFGSDVAKRWGLGYAPGRGALASELHRVGFTDEELVSANLALTAQGGLRDRFYERIMFPIRDLSGRTIAFGGRVVREGNPKYLNTNDTPIFRKAHNLYGLDRAKASITTTGMALVVEGYTDVIALHEAGFTNAVATLGTALGPAHVKLLGRFARKVVYLFDGDEAGLRAADRAAEFVEWESTPEAGAARVDLLVAVIPDDLDPADLIAARGASALSEVVEAAAPLLRFAVDRRLDRWDLDIPEQRSRALTEAVEVLAPVRDSLLADDYVNHIADRLRADFNTVKSALGRVGRGRTRQQPDADGGPAIGSGVVKDDSARIKAERELLAVLVVDPTVREQARNLLAEGLFSDALIRASAEALIAMDEPDAPAASCLSAMEIAVPGISERLSRYLAEETPQEAEVIAVGLVTRIKEFELLRRIAASKAQLKSESALSDSTKTDEILAEVGRLQRELDELRRTDRR